MLRSKLKSRGAREIANPPPAKLSINVITYDVRHGNRWVQARSNRSTGVSEIRAYFRKEFRSLRRTRRAFRQTTRALAWADAIQARWERIWPSPPPEVPTHGD